MLGDTKTNRSKLPKLTIQEQIDNQQVVERMNRKITFTKNQRYLNDSLPYVEALTKQASQSSFAVNPLFLLFNSYEAHHTYESEIKLINNSPHIQRIKLVPLKCRQFVIFNVKYPKEGSGDIAPGLHVSIFIRFRPVSLHDYLDQLVVIVGDGVIKVPIEGKREKWIVKWPEYIDCGHCWVGDEINKNSTIKNQGGEAVFRVKNGEDKDFIQLGCFQIRPTVLKLAKGKPTPLNIKFSPNTSGNFSQMLRLKSDQGEQTQIVIELRGGAYTANLSLQSINGQKNTQQKINNNLYINNCQVGIPSQSKFMIRNLAVVNVDYFWHTEVNDLQINSIKGKMKPSETIQFTLKHIPKSRAQRDIQISLFLFNLPEQSFLNNVSKRTINGIQAIQCMVFNVHIRHQNSALRVTPLHQSALNLQLNSYRQIKFEISNISNGKRAYKITKIKDDQKCESECVLNTGFIQANSMVLVVVRFRVTDYTKEVVRSFYYVEFDNSCPEIISVEGQLTFPVIKIDTNEVYFSICRTQTIVKKRLMLQNEGCNEVLIKFDNPYKYYQLPFYDFYQFQSEQFYQKRLEIRCQKIQNQDGWIAIPPKCKTYAEFILNISEPENISFQVYLLVNHGNTIPIKVVAFAQPIKLTISTNIINLREIYKGNQYNSNKFLKKLLTIQNQGFLDAEYQIIVPKTDVCTIDISPLSGVVKAQSKQRLDLLLQPIKTGDLALDFKINYYDTIAIYGSSIDQNNKISEENNVRKKLLVKQDILSIKATIKGMQINYFIKDQARVKKVRQKFGDDGNNSIKHSTISGKSSYKSGTKTLRENEKLVYPDLEELQFYNCMINQVRQLEIIIENASGLNAQFEVYAQSYGTLQKQQSGMKKGLKGLIGTNEEAFSSEMGKTFIKGRVLDRSQKVHLSNNKGISIMCEPSAGNLAKKQSQKILITMFNDTSGRFRDNLIIAIKDHEVKKFVIDMHIKGTPVSLSKNQLGINFNLQTPLMNLGSFLTKSGAYKKQIKIVNNGPKPVQIDWLFYLLNQSDGRDMFNLTLEEPFPGSGNIVEVKWDAIKPQPATQTPFSIEPRSKVLAGRQQFVFTVTIKEISHVGQFSNLLVGQPYLIEGEKKTEMDTLGVVLLGDAIKPQLHQDRQHQNQINEFQAFPIAPNDHNRNNYCRKIKLKNMLKSNLSFTISIKSSNHELFKILSTSTNSSIANFEIKSIDSKSLTGVSKKPIQKSFVLPYDCYCQTTIQFVANPKDLEVWPLESITRKQAVLLAQFSNGDQEEIELVGWLYRPFIQILMPNELKYSSENFQIDFGTIHVKNYKKVVIYLSNPTKATAKWAITYVKYHQSIKYKFEQALWTNQDRQDQTIQDDKKCFLLSLDSGVLLGESIPIHFMPGTLALPSHDDNYTIEHKPTKVEMVFKPQLNLLYKSKFRVTVEDGPSFDIVVKGLGTYEEQYYKK